MKKQLVISLLLQLQTIFSLTVEHKVDTYALAKRIRTKIKGDVYLRGSPEYESARAVHNGACRAIYPLLITTPRSTSDVSVLVRTASKYNLEISVRSGGHSYQCLGVKDGSLHIDLRALNKVVILSPHLVVIGSGNNFGRILKLVPPEKYTMIHGNSLSVGVGGFIQVC